MFDALLSDQIATEYYNQTILHPIGLVAMIAFGTALLVVPRRYAIVPMLLMACFVAPAQRIVVLGFDFNLLRMMVLLGWARLAMHGEYRGWSWKTLDTLVCSWAVSSALAFVLLHGTALAVVNRLGFLFDALGMYFLFRLLIRDFSELRTVAVSAAIIAIPVAGAFLVEKATARNMFAFLGGVPEITTMRAGQLRCQGAFAHPILAGSFFAALMPLIAAVWWTARGSMRVLAPIGLAGALIVVLTCASSTPLVAMLLGLGAMLLYPLRRYLSWMRLGAVMMLIAVNFVMIAPLWHLLARISIVEGSTGWYRYKLIDEFFEHVSEWWLLGTESTAHWWKWGSADVTNQYVLEGVHGGLLTLVLFLAVIIVAFHAVGKARQRAEHLPSRRLLAWALGCSLFMHSMIFISVAYFGQLQMLWYITIAIIGSLAYEPQPMRIRALVASGGSGPEGARATPTGPTALPACMPISVRSA